MIENGFYTVKNEFIELIADLGGLYQDDKNRPVFCCFKDRFVSGLFWAIPTSDYFHRTVKQIEKAKRYSSLGNNDIRSAFYHIGETNRKAIYRISNCFPIIDKYVYSWYDDKDGKQLFLANKSDIAIIRKKLSRILFDESRKPNKYEQHITDIKNFLIKELQENN